MAFRRKQDTGSGEQFKFEKVGQKLTGYYLGSFDHDGEYGPTKKHVFKTAKGLKVVFGQTHLTQLLDGEKPGQLMQVTYSGDKKMKKGNPMKEYTLDIDDEQVLDADEIPDQNDDSSSGDEDLFEDPSQEDDEPAEVEDEEEPMDEVKTAPAKTLAKAAVSSTKSAVNEILARRAKKTA